MADHIDISGLDEAAVLAALYNGSRPQGSGFMQYDNSPMTVALARQILDTGQTYFAYLKGRVMRVDLREDSFDPWMYDRDNGQGSAARIINAIRKDADPPVNAQEIQEIHCQGVASAAAELADELSRKFSPHLKRD